MAVEFQRRPVSKFIVYKTVPVEIYLKRFYLFIYFTCVGNEHSKMTNFLHRVLLTMSTRGNAEFAGPHVDQFFTDVRNHRRNSQVQ